MTRRQPALTKTGRPLEKPFSPVLQRLMSAFGVHTLKELAVALGATETNVRNWHKRDRVPSDWIAIAAQRSGSTLDEFLSPMSDQYSAELDRGSEPISAEVLFVSEPLQAWSEGASRGKPVHQMKVPPHSREHGSSQVGALLPVTGMDKTQPLVIALQIDGAGPTVNYEVIPRLLGAASAGALPTERGDSVMRRDSIELDRIGELAFSYEWLGRNLHHTSGNLASDQVNGDSMSPTLLDGDTIIVDRGVREAEVDGIYVIAMRGKRLVKRLQVRFDGTLDIISDNSAYKRESIPRGRVAEIEIIGRMVWPRVR